ncbi:MAG: cardiolipin synthase [Ectothiorhodospiraceae bacterium]|nr:cardiolipin synthase [Ectothiorhodospiraceae bacterium]
MWSPFTRPLSGVRTPRRRRRLIIFLVLAHLVGFASSLDALMSTRTSQGAIAWIVSLNAVPYVAVPAYWVLGRSRFQGYVIARRDEDSALAGALAGKTAELWSHRHTPPYGTKDLRAIERLAKMPFLQGNEVELLIDGEAAFESMFKGIESATRYVLVQFYIIRDDALGRALQRRLIERAQAGLDVYLLYDEIGSYRLPASYLRALTDAGVNVHRFHSTRGPGNRFQLNFRNHRKLVVVDGERGWMGGFNVGVEYLGEHPRIGPWRDTHLAVIGPAALNLQLSFVEDWHWATEEILELPWNPARPGDGDIPVLMLASGPADRFETASLMIQQAIHAAQHRIWISSPYFVPDEGVQGMLKLAALGGVDVRILIPERPDNLLTYYAAYAFLEPLIDAGVGIYRYQDGFLHSKAFLVDNAGAAIGTVNLDNRSFRLNFEITAIVLDTGFAAEVEDMFLADFERSRLMHQRDIRERPLWSRITSRAAYLFAPVL